MAATAAGALVPDRARSPASPAAGSATEPVPRAAEDHDADQATIAITTVATMHMSIGT